MRSEGREPADLNWREQRRLRAWELHQQGWHQHDIAAELGVTQGAVSQWIKRGNEGGIAALYHQPAPGRRAALTSEQLAQIPALMEQGASAFGFSDDKWTTARVADVLRRRFGIAYHPGHVSRILKQHYPEWRNLRHRN